MENGKAQVLIIGGGIAGITASLEVMKMGAVPFLVEKGPFLGGHSSVFACKAVDTCLECNVCLVEDIMKELKNGKRFPIYLNSTVSRIKREGEGFRAVIESGASFIDSEKCTGCGICFNVCPGKGDALLRAPSHLSIPPFSINKDNCSCMKDGLEPICKENCPESAIQLENTAAKKELTCKAIILATGYRPFDPAEVKRFNFEKIENMITALELERMLRFNSGPIRPSDGRTPRSVAFIQCVGSRNSTINRDYCSRVCCGYGLRMATRVAYDDSSIKVTVFYMDFQDHTKGFLELKALARRYGVRFLRAMPGEFFETDNKDILVGYYDDGIKKGVKEEFNMVVLSIGISPVEVGEAFSEILGLTHDEDGFLKGTEELSQSGVALAGSVLGPMDISESITSAKRAVFEIGGFLKKDYWVIRDEL